MNIPAWSVWAAAYVVAVLGSGLWVRAFLSWSSQTAPRGEQGAGRAIGKLENILIVTFVALGEYTALALVFAAKGLVQRTSRAGASGSYYVLGTLANLTWSLLVAVAAKSVTTVWL